MTTRFTRRDRLILAMLCQGMDAKEVAARLEIALRTAHKHIRTLYRRAAVAGAHQLVLYVMQQPDALRPGCDCQQGIHLPGSDSCPYCQVMQKAA